MQNQTDRSMQGIFLGHVSLTSIILTAICFFFLFLASWKDTYACILPDPLLLFAACAAIGVRISLNWPLDPLIFLNIAATFLCAVLAALFHQLGWGDVKLVAIGSLLIPQYTWVASMVACAGVGIISALRYATSFSHSSFFRHTAAPAFYKSAIPCGPALVACLCIFQYASIYMQ